MNDTADEPKSLKEIVKFAEAKFNKINPLGLKFDAEVTFVMQILQDKPKLMEVAASCPRSLVGALNAAASIGVSFSPAKNEAYLLSRNVKTGLKAENGKDIWESRIFLEPSYIGLNKVATDTGSIEWVQARVVRKEDSCVDNGVGLRPTHIYDSFGTNESRGEIVGAYCAAKLPSGDILTKFLNKERLDSIRDRSETYKKYKSGTWVTDEEEMVMKAAMRTSFKTWPKTDKFARLEQAVHISNENEGFEPIATSPEIQEFNPDQKAFFDRLITNSDAIGMFCFKETLAEGVYETLYRSFEKGSKGKYQRIVDALEVDGRAQLTDCQVVIEERAAEGDDLGVKELTEDLSKEAVDYILDNTDDDTRQFIQGMDNGE